MVVFAGNRLKHAVQTVFDVCGQRCLWIHKGLYQRLASLFCNLSFYTRVMKLCVGCDYPFVGNVHRIVACNPCRNCVGGFFQFCWNCRDALLCQLANGIARGSHFLDHVVGQLATTKLSGGAVSLQVVDVPIDLLLGVRRLLGKLNLCGLKIFNGPKRRGFVVWRVWSHALGQPAHGMLCR
jgi:hypothetical protein